MAGEYHSADFSFEEHVESIDQHSLPPIKPISIAQEDLRWNEFFSAHSSGDFFKPRNYIELEFASWLPQPQGCEEKVLEVDIFRYLESVLSYLNWTHHLLTPYYPKYD